MKLEWQACHSAKILRTGLTRAVLRQEVRALRHLRAAAGGARSGIVRLLGAFGHCGHVCLVLERLRPSLLDYLSESAVLPAAARLANLRSIAHQLLVSLLRTSFVPLGHCVFSLCTQGR